MPLGLVILAVFTACMVVLGLWINDQIDRFLSWVRDIRNLHKH